MKIKFFVVMVLVLAALCVTLASGTAGASEVRGQVTNTGVPEFTWDNSKFAGLYYDVDKNIGNETITFSLSDTTPTGATLSDQQDATTGLRGVVYETKAQLKTFKYKGWGQYDAIGFLADKYFAAYDPTVTADVTNAGAKVAYLYDASKNRNLMTNEQLSKILIDNNTEVLINSSSPLKLKEGYELSIKSINVNETKVMLELKKNGQRVDTEIVQPTIDNARISDQTYYYKTNLGDTEDIIQIAVHFKNIFHGADKDSATVDGIFQISDTPLLLKSDQQYDKMSIRNVDATDMSIVMDNKDNQITLSKNKDVLLMQNIHIKTADQDGTVAEPLRYYIYKAITAPGSYQLRGTVSNVMQNQVTWNNSTFSGFYYDIDKNLGAETLTFRPTQVTTTGATLSDQADSNNNRGVVYQTSAQLKAFKYNAWGQYDVIGFLANKYFAAYDPTVTANVAAVNESVAYLYDASTNSNLMTNEQISQVLVDNNTEMLINTSSPLKLKEGYELSIKSINVDETKAILELKKNGQRVDTEIVQPTVANADMRDQTYYYKTTIGDTVDIIQIAVHFKNIFHEDNKDSATIDGIFQISDASTSIKPDQQFGKMSIRNVDATGMTITMDNKDNQITLSKNIDVPLMQNIHIKTADQDGTDAAPLRYYIYSGGGSS